MKNKTQQEIEHEARQFIFRAVLARLNSPSAEAFYLSDWYRADKDKVRDRALKLAQDIVNHETTHV